MISLSPEATLLLIIILTAVVSFVAGVVVCGGIYAGGQQRENDRIEQSGIWRNNNKAFHLTRARNLDRDFVAPARGGTQQG
jgi:hypothetical protein